MTDDDLSGPGPEWRRLSPQEALERVRVMVADLDAAIATALRDAVEWLRSIPDANITPAEREAALAKIASTFAEHRKRELAKLIRDGIEVPPPTVN
jgi:predicted DNA-binding transcriptional regulator YafY